MATIGEAIVRRNQAVIEVVHPLPAIDDPIARPLAKPSEISMTRVNRSVDGGPYRSGGEDVQVTLRIKHVEWWMIFGFVFVIGVVIKEITASVALGWIGGAVIVSLLGGAILFLRPSLREKLVADRDGLHVLGGRKPASLPAGNIVRIETYEAQTLIKGQRISSYGVRAMIGDGEMVHICSLSSLKECWWVEETLEKALGRRNAG